MQEMPSRRGNLRWKISWHIVWIHQAPGELFLHHIAHPSISTRIGNRPSPSQKNSVANCLTRANRFNDALLGFHFRLKERKKTPKFIFTTITCKVSPPMWALTEAQSHADMRGLKLSIKTLTCLQFLPWTCDLPKKSCSDHGSGLWSNKCPVLSEVGILCCDCPAVRSDPII